MKNKSLPGTLKISGINCAKYGADSNISIKDGCVVVDEKEYPIEPNESGQPIILVFNGNVENLSIVAGPDEVTINGSVENVDLKGNANLSFGHGCSANISCQKVESSMVNLEDGKVVCSEMEGSTINGPVCVEAANVDDCKITASRVTAKNINGTVYSENIQAKTINGAVEGNVNNCSVEIKGQVGAINYGKISGFISKCETFNGVLYGNKLECNEFNGAAFAGTGMDLNCKRMDGIAIAGTGYKMECETVSGVLLAGTGVNIQGNVDGVIFAKTGCQSSSKKDGEELVVPALESVSGALDETLEVVELFNNYGYYLSDCDYGDSASASFSETIKKKVDEAKEAVRAIKAIRDGSNK